MFLERARMSVLGRSPFSPRSGSLFHLELKKHPNGFRSFRLSIGWGLLLAIAILFGHRVDISALLYLLHH